MKKKKKKTRQRKQKMMYFLFVLVLLFFRLLPLGIFNIDRDKNVCFFLTNDKEVRRDHTQAHGPAGKIKKKKKQVDKIQGKQKGRRDTVCVYDKKSFICRIFIGPLFIVV